MSSELIAVLIGGAIGIAGTILGALANHIFTTHRDDKNFRKLQREKFRKGLVDALEGKDIIDIKETLEDINTYKVKIAKSWGVNTNDIEEVVDALMKFTEP